jgi:hypothetical protein
MIKKYLEYIKESINKPQIGNYAICHEKGPPTVSMEFVKNNIGKIIYYNFNRDFQYDIKYENVPEKLSIYFFNDIRHISEDEIIYWSNNKKDCEIFLAAKKYNL